MYSLVCRRDKCNVWAAMASCPLPWHALPSVSWGLCSFRSEAKYHWVAALTDKVLAAHTCLENLPYPHLSSCHSLFFSSSCFSKLQFSSVAQSCPTLCDPMSRSTPGLPVHHHLSEFIQTHVHRVCDAIQPSHPGSSPSPPASSPSQHQSLFQWVNFSHEVAKVLEFQL